MKNTIMATAFCGALLGLGGTSQAAVIMDGNETLFTTQSGFVNLFGGFYTFVTDDTFSLSSSEEIEKVSFRILGVTGNTATVNVSGITLDFSLLREVGTDNFSTTDPGFTAGVGDQNNNGPISGTVIVEGNMGVIESITVTQIPEPSSALLLILGAFPLLRRKR